MKIQKEKRRGNDVSKNSKEEEENNGMGEQSEEKREVDFGQGTRTRRESGLPEQKPSPGTSGFRGSI